MIAGGVTGVLFTPIPWKLADDISIWTQNWPWIAHLTYGESYMKPAVSKLCPSGCAVNVRMNGKLPTTTNGNTNNALSSGGVCPLCAAAVQMKYSPSRVNGPMQKDGGKYKSISWDEALSQLESKLKAAMGADGKIAVISGDENGTAGEVLSAFLSKTGNTGFYQMPCEKQNAHVAWNKMMNGKGQIGYDLDNADFVLFVGADALDSWGPTVRNQKAFGKGGKKIYYAGPVQNRTAAVSDKWIPLSPSGMAAFCLGMANVLVNGGKSFDGASDFEAYKSLVAEFTPEKVAALTGVNAVVIKEMANRLAQAEKPLVIAGSQFGSGAGAAPIAAAIGLNLILGNLNKPGGLRTLAKSEAVVEGAQSETEIMSRDLADWLGEIASGKTKAPEVLMVYEANPVYAIPQGETAAQAIKKAGFTVTFATYMDETAEKADLVLPTPHSFERYDDIESPYGLGFSAYSVGEPLGEAEFNTRTTPDVLMGMAKKLGFELGFDAYSDVLEAKAAKVIDIEGFKSSDATPWDVIAGTASADPVTENIWEDLMGGDSWVSVATVDVDGVTMAPAGLAQAATPAKEASALALAPVAQLNVGSPSIATPPQNLTTIADTELLKRDMFVNVCGETAGKLGLSQGQKVKLSGASGEITALVNINEGVMPGVVAAPLGFGHEAWDIYTRAKGANVYKVLTVSAEPGTGMTVWTGSKVKIAKI